jgi:hypothetical protein
VIWLSLAMANPCLPGPRAVLPMGPRTVEFADRAWSVHKSSIVPVGAGPNRWSDSEQAVAVHDSELILTLVQEGAGWSSAELSVPLENRPNELQFDVWSEDLDSQAIAGIFMARDDSCEIDVELGRWGIADADNAQFALAPATPDLVHRFDSPSGWVTYRIRWRRRGLTWTASTEAGVFARWRVRGAQVPRYDDHRLHVNLWLRQGSSPAGDGAVRVRVRDLVVSAR